MDSLEFIGTATTLLRLGRFTLLTDPNFLHRGQRAYLGKGLWSRRLTEPSCQPADLPPLDAVVLSHLHGDHFDRVARARPLPGQPGGHHAARRAPAVPVGLRDALGLDDAGRSTASRRTGESLTDPGRCPAVHARGRARRPPPPVMGSLLEHRVAAAAPPGLPQRRHAHRRRTWTPSASGTRDIDVAVVHLGGTRVLLSTVTMDAPMGVEFLRRVEPASPCPCTTTTTGCSGRRWPTSSRRPTQPERARRVRPVRRGERVSLDP